VDEGWTQGREDVETPGVERAGFDRADHGGALSVQPGKGRWMMGDILLFEWWGVIDAGKIFNQELGREEYKPGEIMQVHQMIDDVEVWAEFNSRYSEFRLGFGPNAKYGSGLTIDQAEAIWNERFRSPMPITFLSLRERQVSDVQ
jgi:hypothetical protein